MGDNGRFFWEEFCRPIKSRPISWHTRATFFGGLFRLWRKQGRFRQRSSCSFLRTGCI